MEIKIVKFGGTATKTKSDRDKVIANIKEQQPNKVLAIVSAMGRNGFPYATDTLKELVNEENITKKELDRLLSVGEVVSSIVLTSALNVQGIKAYSLSMKELGLVSNNNYGDGYVSELNNEYIANLFESYDVLVAPGFIALSEESEPITFKRGGSDLSAILLASLLSVNEVILYKDVDGIFPMHPLMGANISYLKRLSYDEMLALLETGYAVIQKDALLEAKRNNISILVKNYLRKNEGTLISDKAMDERVIGINTKQNELRIATFYPEEIKNEIEVMLKNQHIYTKEVQIDGNMVCFKLASSQVFLAKRIIMTKYLITNN